MYTRYRLNCKLVKLPKPSAVWPQKLWQVGSQLRWFSSIALVEIQNEFNLQNGLHHLAGKISRVLGPCKTCNGLQIFSVLFSSSWSTGSGNWSVFHCSIWHIIAALAVQHCLDTKQFIVAALSLKRYQNVRDRGDVIWLTESLHCVKTLLAIMEGVIIVGSLQSNNE